MENTEIKNNSRYCNKNGLSVNIQELDRQRIARDLHDSSLQTLAHLIHQLELSSEYMDVDIIQAKLEIASVSKSLREVIQEIRNIIFDLRPMTFDDLGLEDCLDQLFDDIARNSDMEIIREIETISCSNKNILLGIFRIIQECSSNAIKYSRAKQFFVSLHEKQNQIFLEIKDNGVGFDVEEMKRKEKHFGLSIIEERVSLLKGTMDIVSEKGNGTRYVIVLPDDEWDFERRMA